MADDDIEFRLLRERLSNYERCSRVSRPPQCMHGSRNLMNNRRSILKGAMLGGAAAAIPVPTQNVEGSVADWGLSQRANYPRPPEPDFLGNFVRDIRLAKMHEINLQMRRSEERIGDLRAMSPAAKRFYVRKAHREMDAQLKLYGFSEYLDDLL